MPKVIVAIGCGEIRTRGTARIDREISDRETNTTKENTFACGADPPQIKYVTSYSFDSCGTMARSRRSVLRIMLTEVLAPTWASVSNRWRSSTPATG
jgi:hypothetical protein